MLELSCFAGSILGSDDTVLLQADVSMLDKIVCLGPLVWLFSPALDAVELTLKVCFTCPFVIMDPTLAPKEQDECFKTF